MEQAAKPFHGFRVDSYAGGRWRSATWVGPDPFKAWAMDFTPSEPRLRAQVMAIREEARA